MRTHLPSWVVLGLLIFSAAYMNLDLAAANPQIYGGSESETPYPGIVADTLVAETSLAGNNYNSVTIGVGNSQTHTPAAGYGPSGKCEPHQTNCVIDCKVKCHGNYIEVEIEFERYFTGHIYVTNNDYECDLYKAPAYGQGDKLVAFKLNDNTCPTYGGFVDAGTGGGAEYGARAALSSSKSASASAEKQQTSAEYKDDKTKSYNNNNKESAAKEYTGRNFLIMVQFDPYVVSHDDVSFVARCDDAGDDYGPRGIFFSYTVLDNYPVLVAGRSQRSKLSVEVKRGSSANGPRLEGPVMIGDFITLVLLLRGYTKKDYDMRVASCWAVEGPPISSKFLKKSAKSGYSSAAAARYQKSRNVELIANDCSRKPRLIANFEKLGVQQQGYGGSNTIAKAVTLKAFRFPKSDNVIIRCKVDVCYGACITAAGAYCKPVILHRSSGYKPAAGYAKPKAKLVRPIGDYVLPSRGKAVSYGTSDDNNAYPQEAGGYKAYEGSNKGQESTYPQNKVPLPPQRKIEYQPAPVPYKPPPVSYNTGAYNGYQQQIAPTRVGPYPEEENPEVTPPYGGVYSENVGPIGAYKDSQAYGDKNPSKQQVAGYTAAHPVPGYQQQKNGYDSYSGTNNAYQKPPGDDTYHRTDKAYNYANGQPSATNYGNAKQAQQQPPYASNRPYSVGNYKNELGAAEQKIQEVAASSSNEPAYAKTTGYSVGYNKQGAPYPNIKYEPSGSYASPNVAGYKHNSYNGPSHYASMGNYKIPGPGAPASMYTRVYGKPAGYASHYTAPALSYAGMIKSPTAASYGINVSNYLSSKSQEAYLESYVNAGHFGEDVVTQTSREAAGYHNYQLYNDKRKRSAYDETIPDVGTPSRIHSSTASVSANKTAVVPAVSFIVEQSFNLDALSSKKGAVARRFAESRLRRSPDGSPTVIVGPSTAIWTKCQERLVSLKLLSPLGFNGTVSLRAHSSTNYNEAASAKGSGQTQDEDVLVAGNNRTSCAVERQLQQQTKLELTLNSNACDSRKQLFIASISDGKTAVTETIDCYIEEIYVEADDDEDDDNDEEGTIAADSLTSGESSKGIGAPSADNAHRSTLTGLVVVEPPKDGVSENDTSGLVITQEDGAHPETPSLSNSN